MKKVVIFFMVLIPILAFAQQKRTVESLFNDFYVDNIYYYFEISSDLLQDIVVTSNIDNKSKEQLLKIKNIRMIELDTNYLIKKKKKYEEVIANSKFPTVFVNFDKYTRFFINFTKNLNNKPYKTLVLYKKKGNSKMFLKREIDGSTIEYLLVTDYVAIQIIGDFDLKTISEIQKIVDQLSKISF